MTRPAWMSEASAESTKEPSLSIEPNATNPAAAIPAALSSNSDAQKASVSQYQNPSYQNYLAKQMLANPKTYNIPTYDQKSLQMYAEQGKAHETDVLSSKLGSILDSIDSNKKRSADALEGPTAYTSCAAVESPFDWTKQFDSNTNHYYYYNCKTGISQW